MLGVCTPFDPSSFDAMLNEATQVNHTLVGAVNVELDHRKCVGFWCMSRVNTVHLSSLWQRASDYWFRIPNQPFVFCACNVWEWRCAPLGDVPGKCISDWTFLLPQERARIEPNFNADPVVQVVRASLQALVNGGHGHVDRSILLFGPGRITQVF